MAKHKRNHNKESRNSAVNMPATNRNYKDTIFRMLFSDRKNLLSLYNAVNQRKYLHQILLSFIMVLIQFAMFLSTDFPLLLNICRVSQDWN